MDTKSVLAIVAALALAWLSAAPAAPVDGADDLTASGHTIDGTTTIACNTPTLLFGGAVPHKGFMVQANDAVIINDNGPAAAANNVVSAGFYTATTYAMFITPAGYKPMGPVSVLVAGCTGTIYVAARAWCAQPPHGVVADGARLQPFRHRDHALQPGAGRIVGRVTGHGFTSSGATRARFRDEVDARFGMPTL
jgi:hypothetical protein